MHTNDMAAPIAHQETALEKLQDRLGLIRVKVENVLYELRCYFKPHNVLRLDALPRTRTDRNEVLLHAAFQVLVDFIEFEYPFVPWEDRATRKGRHTDLAAMRQFVESEYGSDARMRMREPHDLTYAEKAHASGLELLELYQWYKEKRWEFDYEAPGTNGYIKMAHRRECDAMLHRAIEIRHELWT